MAKKILENLATFGVQRGKINDNFTELYEDKLEDTTERAYAIEDQNNVESIYITNSGQFGVAEFDEITKQKVRDFVGVIEPVEPIEPAQSVVYKPSLDNYVDVNHILTYGQSLSVGQTEVVISSVSPYPNNLLNFDGVTRTSTYDKSLTGDTYPINRRISFNPLIERVSDGALNTLRETPSSGTAESLAYEINKFSDVKFPTLPLKVLVSAPGWGATTAAQLSKGSLYYGRLIEDVTAGKTIANALGKVYKVLAVTWTQGESDYLSNTSKQSYKDTMIQLKTDLNADIKEITGQKDDIVIVMYQVATSNGGGKSVPIIALAQYELAMTEKGFYMASPMYHMKYNDPFHLKSESSKMIGVHYGFAINKIISEKIDWKPLHPKSHIKQGNIVKVKFEVPKAPLVFAPANDVTLTNKGFSVIKGGVDILTSVSLGDDGISVNLFCSGNTFGAVLKYGFNVTDTTPATIKLNLGNLRDSQGETIKFNINAVDKRVDNWCPIFEYNL